MAGKARRGGEVTPVATPVRLHFLITDLQVGGTPRVVKDLAIRLRPFGFDTAVTCLSPWGPVADELTAAGVPVIAVGATRTTQLPAAVRAVREVTANADVVFSFLVHANVVATLANVGRAMPLIQSIQTTQPRPAWHWWAQGVAARAAVRIIVPSASVAAIAADRSGLAAGRIVVIPNAIDASTVGRPVRPHGPWRIGFIGRLDPIKRVPDLVAAVARMADATLDVYGDGPDRDAVVAAVARNRMDARTTLHGTVTSSAAALATLDTLVLPSDAEGFGLVLIEAMAADVPVVATNVAGIRDVVHDGTNGLLVPPRDPAALASAIERLRADKTLQETLVAGGRRAIRAYAWDVVLPRYDAVIRAVV